MMGGASGTTPFRHQLPAMLPIFPLAGVLLLPRGRLPLNIFEPRYLAMIRAALAGDRLVGMVQPVAEAPSGTSPPGEAPVYRTGCAGRITSFSETDDGRFLITLTGLCRFDIREELPVTQGYRRVLANWDPYAADLDESAAAAVDRPRLLAGLKAFFKLHEITADWEAIMTTGDERLITSLAMICPFAPSEKQALLEARDLAERGRIITALVEMAALNRGEGTTPARH